MEGREEGSKESMAVMSDLRLLRERPSKEGSSPLRMCQCALSGRSISNGAEPVAHSRRMRPKEKTPACSLAEGERETITSSVTEEISGGR